MRKLRVLIADDHQRTRLAIVQVLSNDFKIVGVAGDGEQLVDSAISLNPDVIVSDVSMPLLSGPGALKELSAQGYDIPFVLVSVDPIGANEFIRQGAAAFVDKCDIAYELAPAIHSAALGHTYVSQTARSKTANRVPGGECHPQRLPPDNLETSRPELNSSKLNPRPTPA